MSDEWEQYRARFEPDRLENFEAYVDAWTRDHEARRKFADFDTFARCCDADMTMVRKAPDLIREAEALMSRMGYRLAPGRRWQHTRGQVRTTSERPVNPPPSAGAVRSSRAPKTPRAAAPKKPAPPPKAPPKPTHVECPNDPGMMVPLSGSCMCGWSPSDG